MYFKEHSDGDLDTIFVLDVNTGESTSITSISHDYHAKAEKIKEILGNEETTIEDINDIINANTRDNKIDKLREKLGITVKENGTVELSNGVILPSGIATVFNDIDDLEHGKRLINFAELLMENPREYSREALIAWIMKNPSLTILPDGRIRGFRGLDHNFMSLHKGYGIINGEEVNDHHDNSPGNIIEFPVPMTDHNSLKRCSIGLHVGTWSYASSWGKGKYVSVAFSPADVVSPPSDAYQSKIRVSKMEILEELNKVEYDKKYETKTFC